MRVLVRRDNSLSAYNKTLAAGWVENIKTRASACNPQIVYDIYTFERILPTLERGAQPADMEIIQKYHEDVRKALDDFATNCKCSR